LTVGRETLGNFCDVDEKMMKVEMVGESPDSSGGPTVGDVKAPWQLLSELCRNKISE